MVWGVCGALGILVYAISRMSGHVQEAFAMELGVWHYLTLVGWTLFMAYSEGYRGFQKSFSPRVAARAVYLRDKSTWLRFCLAPLFSIGFFHTTRRKQITVVVLVIVISLVVIGFRQISQPWRGVLDFGVVVGLSWGILSTLIYFVKFALAEKVTYDAMVVEPTTNLS